MVTYDDDDDDDDKVQHAFACMPPHIYPTMPQDLADGQAPSRPNTLICYVPP
jgi:hypothetical protein